jgi:choline-sulfatase
VEKWSAAADDTLLRVPLILRVPGGASGRCVPELVELFDLFATVMELAGIEPRHTHFATSLLPQADGAPGDPGRAAFAEGGYDEPHAFEPLKEFPEEHIYAPKIHLEAEQPATIARTAVIRTREFKLAYRPAGESELYDLSRDPLELDNLFEAAAYAPQRQELMNRLLEWHVRTSGVIPMGMGSERALPRPPKP